MKLKGRYKTKIGFGIFILLMIVSISIDNKSTQSYLAAEEFALNDLGNHSYNAKYLLPEIETPILLSPANGTIHTDCNITLDWNDVPGVISYNLFVYDQIGEFCNIILHEKVYESEYTISYLFDGVYYWAVDCYDGSSGSPLSNFHNFTIEASDPDAPKAIYPTNELIISENSTTLNWTHIDASYVYNLQVANNSEIIDPFIDEQISGNYTLSELSDGDYFWRVQSVNSTGHTSIWSKVWNFGIDTQKPLVAFHRFYPIFPNDNEPTEIYATISDDNEVSVKLHYQVDNGSWNTITMFPLSGYYYRSIGTLQAGSVVEFYIEAYDNSEPANVGIDNNNGNNYSFTIIAYDDEGPTFNDIYHSPTNPTNTSEITIYCNVSDPSGVEYVNIFYQKTGSSKIYFKSCFRQYGLWVVTIGPYDYGTTITYYVRAFDNSPWGNEGNDLNDGNYYKIYVTLPKTSTTTTEEAGLLCFIPIIGMLGLALAAKQKNE